MYLFGERLLVI